MFRKKQKRQQDDFKQAITELNKSFSLITDLLQLKSNFVTRIKEITGVKRVDVFLLNSDENKFLPVEKKDGIEYSDPTMYFLPGDKLIFWLNVNKTVLILSENPEVLKFLSEREKKVLEEMKCDVISPFILMNQVKGFVALGKRDSGKYAENELQILTVLFEQASFAFDNALLYKQQRERSVKMYRADRLATLGELAAGTAHEIRNPLTSIRSTIQYLENKIDDPEDKALAEGLISEVDRINSIIQDLLSFARPEELKMEEADLFDLISQLIRLVENSARKKGINIQMEYQAENRQVEVDTNLIKQALINILMNAIQAIDRQDGKIHIRVKDLALGDVYGNKRPWYLLELSDNGAGIQKKQLDRIFDPFYTTKKEGTGLGLSITYSIIHKHGGEIEIQSEPGHGTLVKIKLPAK